MRKFLNLRKFYRHNTTLHECVNGQWSGGDPGALTCLQGIIPFGDFEKVVFVLYIDYKKNRRQIPFLPSFHQ
jgi:hypothetical protein